MSNLMNTSSSSGAYDVQYSTVVSASSEREPVLPGTEMREFDSLQKTESFPDVLRKAEAPSMPNLDELWDSAPREMRDFLRLYRSDAGTKEELIRLGMDMGSYRVRGFTVPPPRYIYPKDVRDFITRQRKSSSIFQSISQIAEQTNLFLAEKEIKATIAFDLFSDPEYTDWKEPRISVKIMHLDPSKISEFRMELYDAAFRDVRPKIAKNVILHVEAGTPEDNLP